MIPAQVAAEACFFGLTITVVLGCISGTLAHSIPAPVQCSHTQRCVLVSGLVACLVACMHGSMGAWDQGDCLNLVPQVLIDDWKFQSLDASERRNLECRHFTKSGLIADG